MYGQGEGCCNVVMFCVHGRLWVDSTLMGSIVPILKLRVVPGVVTKNSGYLQPD